MRQLAPRAERVYSRGANAELTGDGIHCEQRALDPSWTRRFVFLRCGMGHSWIGP